MKILVTSIVDLQKSANNRPHQLLGYLCQRHEITVLSINDWWKSRQVDSETYNKDFQDLFQRISTHYLTTRKVSPILQEVLSVGALNNILKAIDYDSFDVHYNYNTLLSGYFVVQKMKRKCISTVYDMADDLPEMIRISPQIPALLRVFGKPVGSALIRKNIGIAEKVTFTTDFLRQRYNIPSGKSIHIPNGVGGQLFQSYPSQLFRKELNLAPQDFVIGYVGVLREWIDLESLFTAIGRLKEEYPDIKAMIVGGEGGLEKNKALAQRCQVENKVLFTGTVPYTQVPKYVSCMDVCVIPFKVGGVAQSALPLKLFEYMACSKPVISTRLRGVVEAVQDRVLYASDREEWERRIRELYRDKELREKLGLQGRRFVQQNYEWSRLAAKLEEVLEELASHKTKAKNQ